MCSRPLNLESYPVDHAIVPTSEDHHSSGPHCLPQTLDLTQARPLRDNMIALLRNGRIVLDAGEVERMSTPCVQVLLAVGHAADASNSQFQIVNASDCFRAAIADLGLQSQFTHWMV
jgi:chemotaxis protein CheX